MGPSIGGIFHYKSQELPHSAWLFFCKVITLMAPANFNLVCSVAIDMDHLKTLATMVIAKWEYIWGSLENMFVIYITYENRSIF